MLLLQCLLMCVCVCMFMCANMFACAFGMLRRRLIVNGVRGLLLACLSFLSFSLLAIHQVHAEMQMHALILFAGACVLALYCAVLRSHCPQCIASRRQQQQVACCRCYAHAGRSQQILMSYFLSPFLSPASFCFRVNQIRL